MRVVCLLLMATLLLLILLSSVVHASIHQNRNICHKQCICKERYIIGELDALSFGILCRSHNCVDVNSENVSREKNIARAMGTELRASYSGLLLASSAWAITLSLNKTMLNALHAVGSGLYLGSGEWILRKDQGSTSCERPCGCQNRMGEPLHMNFPHTNGLCARI